MAENALLNYRILPTKREDLTLSSLREPEQFRVSWLENAEPPYVRVGEPKITRGGVPISPVTEAPGTTTAVPVSTNVLTQSPETPATPKPEPPPPDTFQQYWGQPVGRTNIPLDQFVRLAGMTAHALAPREAPGILGRDLALMGHEAYGERMRREYETPNMLLRRRLLEAQIAKEEQKDVPTEWATYFKYGEAQGWPRDKIVENYLKLTKGGKPVTITRTVPNPNFDPTKPVSESNPQLIKRTYMVSDGQVTPLEEVPEEPVYSPFAEKAEERKYKEKEEKRKAAEFALKQKREERLEKAGKLKGLAVNAKGEVIKTYADGSQWVVDEEGEERPATAADLVGLSRLPTAGKEGKKSAIAELEEMRAKKAGGVAAPKKKYTESQLRSMLLEKKRTDPSIDVERAMKSYKEMGLY